MRPQIPWAALVIVVAALVLVPLIPLQVQAWSSGADGVKRLFEMPDLGKILLTTLTLGVGALVLSMVFGTVLALCMYAMRPRLRKWLEFLPVLPLLIPAVAHVTGFVFLFSPQNGYANSLLRATGLFAGTEGPINVYGFQWIIIYTATHLASFVFLFVYTGLRNLGTDYGLAARVNGAGSLRVLLTITLPLLRPTFVYCSVVVFLLSLGQFTGPLILGRRENLDVITTQIYSMTSDFPVDYPLASALGTPLILLAILLIVFQTRAVKNQNRYVGQGSTSMDHRQHSSVGNAISAAIVICYVLGAAIFPILAIAFVALSPFWSGNLSLGSLTFEHVYTVFSDPRILDSLWTTVSISVLCVLIVTPLGMLIALAINQRDRLWKPISVVLDLVTNLPLTVPAALLGVGFLFAFTQPQLRLYGTGAALIIAYVTLMIPYAVRYQLATLTSMGKQTLEASQVSGAHPFRTFVRVILPLSRVGIASSAAITFVLLTHEFGVSLLLRAPRVRVLSVALYDEYSGGSYSVVAVIALIMTAVTAVGVIVALLFGGRGALEKL